MFIDISDQTFMNKNKANPISKFSFLRSLNLENEIERRLSLHLERLTQGSDLVYLTPIAKDNDVDNILKEWDKLFNSKSNLVNSKLLEIEMSNRDKFGPRSIALPWTERRQSTLEYFGDSNCKLSADALTVENRASLRPISFGKTRDYIQNTSNSGLPFYIKKRLVVDKTLSNYDEISKMNYPCILFTRTQEGGKTRDVWGYPLDKTLKEIRYYQPLLGHQKSLNWRSALVSPHDVDLKVSKLILESKKLGLTIISIDFKGFDKSVKRELQRAAFNYIKSLYQKETHDEIQSIEEDFNSIGLVTPSGIIEGSHGVPSGSTFTNEVDSIVQYLVAVNSGCTIIGMVQIQGDDGLYAIKDELVEKFLAHFKLAGLEVNIDKSDVSKDYAVYLQRLYHIDYAKDDFIGGIYSTYRALNRILFQERYSDFEDFEIKGIDYYSIRTISILENVKYHPLFQDFVNFIKKYDKYSLKFSQDGLSKFNNMNVQSDGNVGTIKNQYGTLTRGLRSFESYKIINS